MGARRLKRAARAAGVMALMVLAGVLATCGGPVAFAGVRARRASIVVPSEIRIGNPDARVVRMPVMVAAQDEATQLLGAEVAIAGGRRDGEVVGRALGRTRLRATAREGGGTTGAGGRAERGPDGRGPYRAVVYVPMDMRVMGLSDGESQKVRVKAAIVQGSGTGARSKKPNPNAPEEPGGTERDTLVAESVVAVSALPAPSGDWYPGDAHFHSTVSDGALSLSATLGEAKNTYGMKWLVVTDHWTSGSGMGGVSKYPAGAGAPAGFPSYYDSVLRYGVAQGLPVGPGCEWSSAKNAIPGSGSHVLGFEMSRAANSTFPVMYAESRESLVRKLNMHNPGAFTVAAHPVGTQANGFYDWVWSVPGNDCVELFTDMHSFHETVRTNWFARLRSELPTVIAKGPRYNFTVGIATSDGHANGITAVAGGSSMTWLWLPNDEGNRPSPDNVTAVWHRMRRGQCVASGDGDFARAAITATAGGMSAQASVGELVKSSSGVGLQLSAAYNSRTGHRLKSIDVWRGDAEGITKSGPYAVDAVSGTRSIALPGPRNDCFYVVVGHFYDPASLNTAARDVVCNPVWVDVVP